MVDLARDPTDVVPGTSPHDAVLMAVKDDGSIATARGGVAFVASFEPPTGSKPTPV